MLLFLVLTYFYLLTADFLQSGTRHQLLASLAHTGDMMTVISLMSHSGLAFYQSHDIIQHMTDDLNTNAAKVGLRISCEKTKAMFVGEPPTTSISVGSNLLQSVDNFQYLGSYISNCSLTLKLTYEQD